MSWAAIFRWFKRPPMVEEEMAESLPLVTSAEAARPVRLVSRHDDTSSYPIATTYLPASAGGYEGSRDSDSSGSDSGGNSNNV